MKLRKAVFFVFALSLSISTVNPAVTMQVLADDILLTESFHSSVLPSGWEVIEGQAAIQGQEDGALVLSSPSASQPARILAPDIGADGNYVIEAEMTFLSASEDTRWASVLYRVQDGHYPYYQMAVRRGANALNGVEFSMRNKNDQWSIFEKGPYSEPLAFHETYKLKIVAKNNRVQQYINGQLMIDTDQAGDLQTGRIGFQASGSIVKFDNIQIKKQIADLPFLKNSGAFLGSQAKTAMLNAPTVISSVPYLKPIPGVSSMILQPDARLTVNGIPLQVYLEKLAGQTIPLIQLEDEAVARNSAALLYDLSVQDVHLLSTQPYLLKLAKKTMPSARGALIYSRSSMNKQELKEFIQSVHASGAKTAVFPQHLLTVDTVHYLHSRAVSVWGKTEDETELNVHRLIHAGVDGIISGNTKTVTAAFKRYPEKTIVQRPIVAAHRGIPSLAPENTMAGFQMSYKLGADLIETDVQQTKDGEVIVMHDYTVDRTTNGTGYVKDMTLKQIRALDAGSYFGEEFTGEKVPTFQEFLKEFKGKNVILLVELKTEEIVEKTIQLIEKEKMADQVVLQSFHMGIVRKLVELAPNVPSGFLYSSDVPQTEAARLFDARKKLGYAASLNATLNSSYSSLSPEFITYLRQRGMISYHWTFRSKAEFEKQLKTGMIGPITDYTQWLTNAPVRIETSVKKRTMTVGRTADIQAKAFLSYRTNKTEDVETTLFTAGNSVSVNGHTIRAEKPGTSYVFAQHTFTMLDGKWTLVSEPMEIIVK